MLLQFLHPNTMEFQVIFSPCIDFGCTPAQPGQPVAGVPRVSKHKTIFTSVPRMTSCFSCMISELMRCSGKGRPMHQKLEREDSDILRISPLSSRSDWLFNQFDHVWGGLYWLPGGIPSFPNHPNHFWAPLCNGFSTKHN